MHVEGAQRVLVVGGREDHRYRAAQQLQHFEAIELRHLDVEEHQVRRQLGHRLHGVETVAALGHDAHALVRAEVLAHDAAGQGLIVHDDHAQGIGRAHFASVDTGKDSSMRQTPPRSVLLTTASPP